MDKEKKVEIPQDVSAEVAEKYVIEENTFKQEVKEDLYNIKLCQL